jgi:hypothetical protein
LARALHKLDAEVNIMKTIKLVCSVGFALVSSLVACASNPDSSPAEQSPPVPVPVRPAEVAAADASVPPDATPTAPATDADAGADAEAPACSTLASTACLTCCDLAYPDVAAAMTAAVTECACVKPGECATDCKTNFCAGKNATAACAACIQKSNTCGPATATVCKASPACTTYVSCLGSCKAP